MHYTASGLTKLCKTTRHLLISYFQRVLALIYLAHASDVLENAFAPLSDEDYDVAMKRVRYLLGKSSSSLLPIFEDISISRMNSNGTYRQKSLSRP